MVVEIPTKGVERTERMVMGIPSEVQEEIHDASWGLDIRGGAICVRHQWVERLRWRERVGTTGQGSQRITIRKSRRL